MHKKGLSTVVTSLIMILLVLISIGIIWLVIRNFIETGTENFDVTSKCLLVDVRLSSVTCPTYTGGVATCGLTIERKSGGEAIGGVKVVYSGPGTSNFTDYDGNIAVGSSLVKTAQTITMSDPPTKATLSAYFLVEGEQKLCSQTSEYTIA